MLGELTAADRADATRILRRMVRSLRGNGA
jgi:hypothetical protein